MVDFDEDGGAELDGLRGVVPGIYSRGAPADVGVALEDVDVEGDAGGVRVLGEVVGGG